MKRLTSTNNANFVEDDFKRALYDIKKKLNRDTGSVSGLMKNVKEFDMEEDLDKYLELSKKYIPRVTSNFQEVIYEVQNVMADLLNSDPLDGHASPLYDQSNIRLVEMHQVLLLILYLNQKKYGWNDDVYDKIYYVFHENNMMNYILTAALFASFPYRFLSTLDISILFTDDISEYKKLSDTLVHDILFNPDYSKEEFYDEYDINVGYVESKLNGIMVLERGLNYSISEGDNLTRGNAFTLNNRNPLDYMDVVLLYNKYYITSYPYEKVRRGDRNDDSFRYPYLGSDGFISGVADMTNHTIQKVTRYDPIMGKEVKRYKTLYEVLDSTGGKLSPGVQPDRDFKALVRQTTFMQKLKRLEEEFIDDLRKRLQEEE